LFAGDPLFLPKQEPLIPSPPGALHDADQLQQLVKEEFPSPPPLLYPSLLSSSPDLVYPYLNNPNIYNSMSLFNNNSNATPPLLDRFSPLGLQDRYNPYIFQMPLLNPTFINL